MPKREMLRLFAAFVYAIVRLRPLIQIGVSPKWVIFATA